MPTQEFAEQAIPNKKRGRAGKWIRRVLFAAVSALVIAGISGTAYLMCVVIPRRNALLAQATYMPVLRAAQVGDSVTLGKYEQDNDLSDGAEPIEWLVLARQPEKLLLISKYALDCIPFNSVDGITSWDSATIRRWLNDDFYTTAFSASERLALRVSRVVPDRNALFDTDPGKVTKSRIFLLSIAEAEAFFRTEDERRCAPTAYAEAQGAQVQVGGFCMWWLRTPGYDCSAAARVLGEGSVSFIGQPAHRNLAVRPAMWVDCGEDMGA